MRRPLGSGRRGAGRLGGPAPCVGRRAGGAVVLALAHPRAAVKVRAVLLGLTESLAQLGDPLLGGGQPLSGGGELGRPFGEGLLGAFRLQRGGPCLLGQAPLPELRLLLRGALAPGLPRRRAHGSERAEPRVPQRTFEPTRDRKSVV